MHFEHMNLWVSERDLYEEQTFLFSWLRRNSRIRHFTCAQPHTAHTRQICISFSAHSHHHCLTWETEKLCSKFSIMFLDVIALQCFPFGMNRIENSMRNSTMEKTKEFYSNCTLHTLTTFSLFVLNANTKTFYFSVFVFLSSDGCRLCVLHSQLIGSPSTAAEINVLLRIGISSSRSLSLSQLRQAAPNLSTASKERQMQIQTVWTLNCNEIVWQPLRIIRIRQTKICPTLQWFVSACVSVCLSVNFN